MYRLIASKNYDNILYRFICIRNKSVRWGERLQLGDRRILDMEWLSKKKKIKKTRFNEFGR
jgi:hypothetical protein